MVKITFVLKNLFYNLFNSTYKNVEDPIERYNLAKRDVENLAAIDSVNPDGTKGKGIFRRLDGTTKNGSVVFTAFYDGTLPGERITFKEIKEEIDSKAQVGLGLNQVLRDNKVDGKLIVSDTELTKVATQIRSGSDSIIIPENVRLLEQFYPSFDAQPNSLDELVADAEQALADEPEINGIKSLNFRSNSFGKI